MSINDRLRVKLYASAGGGQRAYGASSYGGLDYGDDASWTYGEFTYGDYDFGRRIELLTPDGKPFNCVITGLTLDLGRDRVLDQNKIGVCSVQLVQMDVPDDWLAEVASQTPVAVVLGRTLILEAFNDGNWESVFVGTVESAVVEEEGTGSYEQPALKWEILALDSLNRLRRITEAPGTVWRAEEPVKDRLDFIAGQASLGTRYLQSYPMSKTHPSEFTTNLLEEAQQAAKYGYRLAAAQYGSDIDVEELNLNPSDLEISNSAYGLVFISSPYELWQTSLVRMLLPCPVKVNVSWPMDRLLNQVTVTTPDVPTDPTPDEYVQRNEDSIFEFGRRTYEDQLPMVEAAGVQTPALNLGFEILDAYGSPRPWVTQVLLDFTTRIDLDTKEPVVDGVTYIGRYECGFAYAIRMLRGTRLFAVSLPSSDAGRLPVATGYVIGVRWNITAYTAQATVMLETPPYKYGTEEDPAHPPLEPAMPTGIEAISVGMLEKPPPSVPIVTFTIPDTVQPHDVQVELEMYDPGQYRSYFLRCPTTLNVPRVEGKVASSQLSVHGVDAAGARVVGLSQTYNVGMAREILYWIVTGDHAFANRAAPGEFIPNTGPTAVSPSVSHLWFAPGNQASIGWAGVDDNYATKIFLFDFKIRNYTTQEILLHIRPQDWAVGSWVDPYGNIITVTEAVTYSNDLDPEYLEA